MTTKSDRTERGLAPASVNRELSVLRAVLRLAADEDYSYLTKVPLVRMEDEPEGRLRYLTEDDECGPGSNGSAGGRSSTR